MYYNQVKLVLLEQGNGNGKFNEILIHVYFDFKNDLELAPTILKEFYETYYLELVLLFLVTSCVIHTDIQGHSDLDFDLLTIKLIGVIY